ncbi:histidine kinase dimerization/phospho-acceptor domain-containing protein [Candidatus Margulisiibacteriota bacterium]
MTMYPYVDRINIYYRAKWGFVFVVFLLFFIEFFIGQMTGGMFFMILAVLCGAVVTAGLLTIALRRGGLIAVFTHISLATDIVTLIFILYFTGGVENIWFFTPVLLILSAAYIFGLNSGMVYAALSFVLIFLVFTLEYLRIIPHFSLHNIPEIYWRIPFRTANYLVGLGMLFFIVAFSIGKLTQLTQEKQRQHEESLADAKASQKNAEESQQAMMNVAEDLERAKAGLEKRVRERTAELEDAKANLEKRVAERTVDLEKARQAVQHMLRDLKDDMEKLRAIDRMKTEFLSMVSHELRTPITPIKGYAALLLAGKMGKLLPAQVKAITTLNRQSDHLQGLIDSLLDISRLELGKPIPIEKTPLSMKK